MSLKTEWQLIDPHGKVVATERTCIKAWARIYGYKPTVEDLLGYEQNGWQVLPVARVESSSLILEREEAGGETSETHSVNLDSSGDRPESLAETAGAGDTQ